MSEPKNSWSVWRWARHEDDGEPITSAPPPLTPEARRALLEQLKGRHDDDTAEVPVWALLALMAETEPRGRTVPGVWIQDDGRGVNYRATIHEAGADSRLRTLEIEPTRDDADETVFHPPVKSIIRTARRHLRERERIESADGVLFLGSPAEPTRPGHSRRPSDEVLCAHLREDGWTRSDIADEYGVSPGAAGQWLRRARKNSPELPWPPRERGPKPRD